MTLLVALDPALFIYRYEDWQTQVMHCLQRFEVLEMHRRVIHEYGQKMAMSDTLAALISQFFPWNSYRSVPELRDLFQFVVMDLQKAHYVDIGDEHTVHFEPLGILYRHLEETSVIDAWEYMICACVDESVAAEFETLIATWQEHSVEEYPDAIMLTIDESDAQVPLLLVWNDDAWSMQLVKQEWWPDLQRCVELYFKTNHALQAYHGVRQYPIPFTWSKEFESNIERYCEGEHLRQALIEAVAKRVYGVLDSSLGDEPFKKIRRFRVTDFWRVHYHEEQGKIILDEFGPHGIGGVS